MARLRKGGELAQVQVEQRETWCKRVLAWPKGSRQRGAEVKAMMADLGLSRSMCGQIVNAYDRDGLDGIRRSDRSDAGKPRAGTRQERREAARLAELGYDEEAARLKAEADRLALELQNAFVNFAKKPEFIDAPTTVQRREFSARWKVSRPDAEIPCCETLRAWIEQSDDSLGMTERERRAARTRRHRIKARYPNHVWQADQRTADVQVREEVVDLRTGEISERVYRPFLFHFVDVFSGREMGGMYFRSYDTNAVELALINAIYPDVENGLMASGTPEIIYWDKGEQHWSHWCQRMATDLDIKLLGRKSEAAVPTNHGFVENTHGIVKSQFEVLLPTFLGGDNRQENRPLGFRLVADGEAPATPLPTLDEVNAAYIGYLQWLEVQPYRDGEKSRAQLWSEAVTPERRAVPDRAELGWKFMKRATRKVSKEGQIRFKGLVFTGPNLGDYAGLTVQIHYLDSWYHHIWIADERGHLATIAEVMPDVFYDDDDTFAYVARARAEVRGLLKLSRRVRGDMDTLSDIGALDRETAERAAGALEQAEHQLVPGKIDALEFARRVREKHAERAAAKADQAEVVRLHPKPDTRPLATDPPEDDGLISEVVAGATQGLERQTSSKGGGLFDFD